ncbi:hypothetical protein V5F38_15060 [Xanthobacter sp. V0B-10]|uniref:hypothetical protein n=1 Tax=Xanthobacter albus TaxID=3119929 RepID=UPI003728E6C8
MRTPHRRDISARQDLLGRELRQLFDDYSQEDMPEELRQLALRLQSAVEERPDAAPAPGDAATSPRPRATNATAAVPAGETETAGSAADKSSLPG